MSADQIGVALIVLGLFLLLGKVIRVKVGWVQKLFLPSSIVGGALLLMLGPQVLGRVGGPVGETSGGARVRSTTPTASGEVEQRRDALV